ncbi:MAG: helix-turn-helix domain-containing protein [Planctomycetia bacterium]|jgi:excisionase family DNA binding protein
MMSQNMPDLPLLLTEHQAAELVGVTYRTWRRWCRSGLAPAPVKIGRGRRPVIRVRRDELLAWIDGGCKAIEEW